eukprot:403377404
MKSAKSTALLVLIALFGISITKEVLHPVRQELVEEIKLKATTWQPREIHHNRLRDVRPEQIQKKLGNLGTYQHSFIDSIMKWIPFGKSMKGKFSNPLLEQANSHSFRLQSSQDHLLKDSIPLEFDFRTKWPQCLRKIRDQANCGACWAFTGSGMLADRICILTNGTINEELSPQDMVDCSHDNFGCEGGYLMNALDYLMNEGVTKESCTPYKDKTNKCQYTCQNKTEEFHKHYCKPGTLRVLTNEEQIKRDLMQNGPLMVGLTVYEDFINYATGDYKFVAGEIVGGHAVKLMGWRTTQKGQTSWLIQNQWNDDWGEQGFGYILENEVGIDSIGVGCTPDIDLEYINDLLDD